MLCMFVYLFSKEKPDEKDTRPRAPIAVCFIPLAMDLCASTLEMVALNYLSGSVFSIVSSIVIVSTAVFTKILLRKTFKNAQIVGCLFAIAGVLLTGFAEYTEGTSDTPKVTQEISQD
jgi:drug/metabolite transporter (DMT)-like permease